MPESIDLGFQTSWSEQETLQYSFYQTSQHYPNIQPTHQTDMVYVNKFEKLVHAGGNFIQSVIMIESTWIEIKYNQYRSTYFLDNAYYSSLQLGCLNTMQKMND